MTVQELIDRLNKIEDKALPVITPGYEGGYDDLKNIYLCDTIERDVNTEWYYGKHEKRDLNKPHNSNEILTSAVIIS